jgi:predicted metalloprotease with PDZ domain
MPMKFKRLFILAAFLFSLKTLGQGIIHQLGMPSPQTHYFDVTTTIDLSKLKSNKGFVEFKMPAWTPGSYLIREYAKNVEQVKAYLNQESVVVRKSNKNTWKVTIPASLKTGKLSLNYQVYAFEMSVRTSFLDDSHGYINPASVFMFVEDLANMPISLKVIPHASFSKVSTAMAPQDSKFSFIAKNLDEFIDSPIEIGNHQIFSFKVKGVPHQIAFYGPAKVDTTKFLKDVEKMCLTAMQVVGEHPCDHYLFIIHNLNRGGGGLEHLNSTTCQVTRSAYENENGYNGIMNLLAHEYFHLWNVKRIRPIALGPFDYENENYTHILWFSEGITSYYADLLSYRAGFVNKTNYLKGLSDEISGVENTPGNKVDPVADASWDAWIKYYRPNENSRNSSISYYDKGSVLGGVMNLWIISNSKGKKSLDDVFKYLYDTYYKKMNRGFTDAELENAFSTVAGTSAKEFFSNLIYDVKTPPYAELLKQFGFDWIDANATKEIPYIGCSIVNNKVTSVYKGSSAYQFGLNVGDEIIKVNNDLFEGMDKLLANKKVGDSILFTVKRDGLEKNYLIPVVKSPLSQFEIKPITNPSLGQKELETKWLGL